MNHHLARCTACGRYTDHPAALSKTARLCCDCGRHGTWTEWQGKPGQTAVFSHTSKIINLCQVCPFQLEGFCHYPENPGLVSNGHFLTSCPLPENFQRHLADTLQWPDWVRSAADIQEEIDRRAHSFLMRISCSDGLLTKEEAMSIMSGLEKSEETDE